MTDLIMSLKRGTTTVMMTERDLKIAQAMLSNFQVFLEDADEKVKRGQFGNDPTVVVEIDATLLLERV